MHACFAASGHRIVDTDGDDDDVGDASAHVDVDLCLAIVGGEVVPYVGRALSDQLVCCVGISGARESVIVALQNSAPRLWEGPRGDV